MTQAPQTALSQNEPSARLTCFCRFQFSVSPTLAPLTNRAINGLVQDALITSGALASQPDGSPTKVRFGPVLPPGCSSAREFCDAEVKSRPDDALRAANAEATEGIQFLRVDPIDTKAEPIGQLVAQADYCFEIPLSIMRAEDLEALRDLFSEQAEWLVRKETPKGEVREKDLKKAVLDWAIAFGADTAFLRLRLLHAHEEGHTASPASIMESLLDLDPEQCSLVRIRRECLRDRNALPLAEGPWPRKRNRLLRPKCWEQQRYGL